MTRTLRRLVTEITSAREAGGPGLVFDVRGLVRARMAWTPETYGTPLERARTVVRDAGSELWPSDDLGEAVRQDATQERLRKMLTRLCRPEHAADVANVAEAFARSLGGTEAQWWWIEDTGGSGAAAVGVAGAWAVRVER